MRHATPILLATLFVTPLSLPAQSSLLVLSKQDRTLAIVNPSNLQVVAKVPVGPDPHEVIASTDGATAYVSDYGGGAYSTLSVVDLVSHKALPPIELSPLGGPHGLAFVGGKVWFTSEAARAVGRYDLAAHKLDLALGTGQNRTHMISVSPDQKRIISINTNTVTIFTLEPVTTPGPPRSAWSFNFIPVGRGSEGFDISPDGKQLWTSNSQDGTISVIDLATQKVIDTLAADVSGANRLKFTPDGRHVLVSILNGPNLVILDTATRKVIQRLPIGHGAAGILMDPSGNRAFIACTPDNYVVVLDLHTFKIISHLDVGHQPDGMAWTVRH